MSESDGGGSSHHADDGTSQQVTIPVEADFLYVYSTADGLYLNWITMFSQNIFDCLWSSVWYRTVVTSFTAPAKLLHIEPG